jgi:flagellar FliL protein
MAAKQTKPPAPETEAGSPGKKKRGKKVLLVPVVVVVLAVAAFGYMSLGKKKAAAAPGSPTTTVGGPIVDENSLTVNLRDGHYLEFTVGIQINPGQSEATIVKDQAIVLDILNNQAQGLTEAKLLEPGGPAKLKLDIMRALDNEWPGLVQAVYFEQFVMQ